MATLLLHAEGDSRTGLGHLVRMAGVAGELAEHHSVHLASGSRHMASIVAELAPWARGHFDTIPLEPDEVAAQLSARAQDTNATLLVSDGKIAFEKDSFAAVRGARRVVLVDNVVASPASYDELVLPTCHADPEIVARVGRGRVHTGAAWTFLHPAVRELVQAPPLERRGVFVSMGGADPMGLTERAVRRLLADQETIVAVVGRANPSRDALEAIATAEPRLQLVSGSPYVHRALASSAWALCAFGISAYEAIALATPLVVVPHDGLVDGDIERFVKAFAGRVTASASPEGGWSIPRSVTAAPALGGLAASIAGLC